MPKSTAQQIANYFSAFSNTDVTFTKEVNQALRLNAAGVQLKCLGDQWPCVIYSSSMTSARIIANLQSSLNETLLLAKNSVSLRFSFHVADKPEPLAFFVPAKIARIQPYEDSRLHFADLTFNQRPPDDLILVLGSLLETHEHSTRRSERRLQIIPATIRALRLTADRCTVTQGNDSWRVILRDISFSGCKVIVASTLQTAVEDDIVVHLEFEDPNEEFDIRARVQRTDTVEGHDEIGVFGVRYYDDSVPLAYKLRVNAVVSSLR